MAELIRSKLEGRPSKAAAHSKKDPLETESFATGPSPRTLMKKSTISETPALFIDTWGWLCLADAGDPAHEAAKQAYRRYAGAGRLVTTDYVLDEMMTRLFSKCPFKPARAFWILERCSPVGAQRDSDDRVDRAGSV